MKKLLSLSVVAGALFASVGCEEAKKTPTGGTAPKPGDMKKDEGKKPAEGDKKETK